MPTQKKVEKKVAPEKPVATIGVAERDPNLIQRKGYRLYFLDPNTDQQLMTDLRNTGKVIGEVTVMNVTPDDKVDEVVVIVRD